MGDWIVSVTRLKSPPPDDAFRAGWRKLGPKNKIPEVFIPKKAKKKKK